MRIAKISTTFSDYPCPDDCAILVTLVGCNFNCPGCQNKELQDPNYPGAKVFSSDNIVEMIRSMDTKTQKYSKIVFVGGEPLYKSNVSSMRVLVPKLKELGYDICIYTGHNLKQAEYELAYAFGDVKYIKTGLYDESLAQVSGKTDTEMTFGSSNQELYKIDSGKIILKSLNGIVKFD